MKKFDEFIKTAEPSQYTDVTGGVLQAAEFLNETGARKKIILIFSDLKEELKPGYVRDFDFTIGHIKVIVLNVTKLLSDNIDPREYLERLLRWQKKIERAGGEWQVLQDLDRIEDEIFK